MDDEEKVRAIACWEAARCEMLALVRAEHLRRVLEPKRPPRPPGVEESRQEWVTRAVVVWMGERWEVMPRADQSTPAVYGERLRQTARDLAGIIDEKATPWWSVYPGAVEADMVEGGTWDWHRVRRLLRHVENKCRLEVQLDGLVLPESWEWRGRERRPSMPGD